MPSLRMKTKFDKDSLRENNGLHVCKKSTVISKNPCSHVIDSQVIDDLDGFHHDCHPDLSSAEPFARNSETNEETASLVMEETSRFQTQAFSAIDGAATEIMESNQSCTTDVETIFSPALESTELRGDGDLGRTNFSVMADGTVDNSSSYTEQSCNISDFFISDMIISNIPFEKSRINGGSSETNSLPDYICTEPSMLFDVTEQYIVLPYLEDQTSNKDLQEASIVLRDEIDMCPVVRARSNNEEDPRENFDPRLIRDMPELSDMVRDFLPDMLQKDKKRRKTVTLVLDLDETLVHSTLEHSEDADFTFPVFFNMEEHKVYVKQRPHLGTFLEKVAEMFEVIVFTASQSIYAAKLLDILDPDGKIISKRMYRESCIFTDGCYTKDLTVLGIDLAKVAIIDNSPQVFRFQVNNGIPIKSWFDDPSDNALISLLPFLETLVDTDDVRPIIAKRFGNKE